MTIRDILSDDQDFGEDDDAALPSDVRKVSDFPAATPEFRGLCLRRNWAKPVSGLRLSGKAKPYRTSGGKPLN